MARTTKIELKGDRYKARQLSLAHTNRLLEKFRGFNDFNKLMTNSHREDFFDDTGAYIGSIKMQTVFGTEKVIVEVGAGKPVRKQELWREKKRQVDLIVPVMRSIDNHYWVVCLSGTFEPPYLVFENIYDIPAEEMDDNVEINMDKKLISTLNEKHLYFIAQTGVRPSAEEIEWKYHEEVNEPYYRELSFGEKQAFYVFSGTCCEGGYEYISGPGFKACYSMAPPPYSFTKEHHQEFEVFGQVAALPNSESFESGTTTSVHAGGCSDVWGDCETATGFALSLYTQAKDLVAWGSSYPGVVTSEDTLFTKGIGRFGQEGKSIRLERDNVDNVASCYSVEDTTETHTHTGSVSGGCVFTATVGSDVYTTERSYSYYFRVDSDIFILRGPSADENPYYQQSFDNQVKYYNTDSIARVTGMMSAILASGSTSDNWIEYYYVGPNSQGALAGPVQFSAVVINDAYAHTMPDIGLPVDTLFRGEIFLALLRTTKEDTVQIL